MMKPRRFAAIAGMVAVAVAAVGFATVISKQDPAPATTNVDASVRGVSDEHGSIRSIRGIEGIDTVMLENLEVVLRMQERPQEDQGKGGASAAAALMASQVDAELDEVPDARDVHMEFELEGS